MIPSCGAIHTASRLLSSGANNLFLSVTGSYPRSRLHFPARLVVPECDYLRVFIWVRPYIAIQGGLSAYPHLSAAQPVPLPALYIQSNTPYPEARYSAEDPQLETLPQFPFQALRVL